MLAVVVRPKEGTDIQQLRDFLWQALNDGRLNTSIVVEDLTEKPTRVECGRCEEDALGVCAICKLPICGDCTGMKDDRGGRVCKERCEDPEGEEE